MGRDEKKYERHPSWVTVQFSRISGSRSFFGSSVKSQSWIRLRVARAEKFESFGQDRIHGGLAGDLIEVDLSPAQFAELLTTMNVGTGVPGTLTYFDGKRIESYEETENEGIQVKEHYRKVLHESAVEFENGLHQVKTMMAKDKLSKVDRQAMVNLMSNMVQHFKSNAPFYLDQYNETTDKIKTQMKAEVEAFVTHAITTTGLDVLQGKAPTMIEGKKEKK